MVMYYRPGTPVEVILPHCKDTVPATVVAVTIRWANVYYTVASWNGTTLQEQTVDGVFVKGQEPTLPIGF